MPALVAGIHVFLFPLQQRRGWPGQARHDKTERQIEGRYFPARGGGRSFIDAFSFAMVALKYSSRSLLKRC